MSETDSTQAYRPIAKSLFAEEKRKCNDAIWIPCIIGVSVAVIVLFSTKWNDYFEGLEVDPVSSLLFTVMGVSSVLGAVFGVGWLCALFFMKGISVKVSIFLWIAFLVGFGIYLMTEEATKYNAYTNFAMAAGSCLWFYCVKHKIPFAQICVDLSMDAFRANKGAIFFAVISVLVNVGWGILEYLLLMVWMLDSLVKNAGSTDIGEVMNKLTMIILAVFLTNSFFQSTVSFVSHMTTVGSVASYLTTDNTKDSSSLAFKRAATTSLGSACLGAFVITCIDLVRFLLNWLFDSPILRCLCKCFKRLVLYFSAYSFVHVAVFGDTFCEGCKSTVALFKSSGIEVIVNDSIISRCIAVGALICGLIVGSIGAGWYASSVTDAAAEAGINSDFLEMQVFIYLMFWICFSIGKSSAGSLLLVIFSAVATIFVVWAESPADFSAQHPETYKELTKNGEAVFKFKVAAPQGGADPEAGAVAMDDVPTAEAVPTAEPVGEATA